MNKIRKEFIQLWNTYFPPKCPECKERSCECDPTPSDEELEWSAGCSIPNARERQLMGLDKEPWR